MVRWVNAQQFQNPIADSILQFGQSLYGDTLTPTLKGAQLGQIEREETGLRDFADGFRLWGDTAAKNPAPAYRPGTGAPPTPAQVPAALRGPTQLRAGIETTAGALGMHPVDLATIISYETGGTFDPVQTGPVTQHGQHRGLIQFGEPQAAQYGVDWNNPVSSQLGPDGAIVRYFRQNGWQPGMGLMDAYSIVNAGRPGAYGASDAANGGAPGTVADKVTTQFTPHRDAVLAAWGMPPASMPVGGSYMAGATPSPMTGAPDTRPGRFNPNNKGQMFGEIMARAVMAGLSPQEAADAARMFSANVYGAENQQTTDAVVGAGGSYASTFSGFAADQNRQERDSVRDDTTSRYGTDQRTMADMRGQDLKAQTDRYGTDMAAATAAQKDENDLVEVLRGGAPVYVRKRNLMPTDQPILAQAERQGLVAGNMDLSRPETLAYIGAEPKAPPKADTYVGPDGLTYRSTDGMTDATTGRPLPQGAIQTTLMPSDRAGAGLDKLNARATEASLIAANRFLGTMERARAVAVKAGKQGFGPVGVARSLAQDMNETLNVLAETLRPDVAQTVSDLKARAASDPVARQFFETEYDPALPALEMYARLLPYEAAAAVADQTGRGLSNQDVDAFRVVVGDPTSFWGSQQSFLVKLDTLEAEVNARIAGYNAVLQGGANAGAAPPPAAAPAGLPTPQEIEAMDPAGVQQILNGISDVSSLPDDVLQALLRKTGVQ